jgi:hypothetical protein
LWQPVKAETSNALTTPLSRPLRNYHQSPIRRA